MMRETIEFQTDNYTKHLNKKDLRPHNNINLF